MPKFKSEPKMANSVTRNTENLVAILLVYTPNEVIFIVHYISII